MSRRIYTPAPAPLVIPQPVPQAVQIPKKKAYYVEEAAELLSLGRSLVLRLIEDGHLHAKPIYGRVVIADAELDRFLADPEAVAKAS